MMIAKENSFINNLYIDGSSVNILGYSGPQKEKKKSNLETVTGLDSLMTGTLLVIVRFPRFKYRSIKKFLV